MMICVRDPIEIVEGLLKDSLGCWRDESPRFF